MNVINVHGEKVKMTYICLHTKI